MLIKRRKFKIGMMTAWNTDSGVAVHAEPLAKAWIEMGHKVKVFSFKKDDFHGDGFTGEDEGYVVRCLGTSRTNFLDPVPILSSDLDVLVVQDLRMLPVENLAKISYLIKSKVKKTVHIVHENSLPREPWFYQFDWDEVVYFDERQKFLKDIYPKAEFIPFPCFPNRREDKVEARKKLSLPLDRKIIYSFCQRGYELYLRNLPEELKEKVILLIVIPKGYEMLEKDNVPPWMIIREEEVLSKEKFDSYLFASDMAILHKFQSRYYAVVSSTVFQALGAGCPVLIPGASSFFYPLKDEVIRYGDAEELSKIVNELCTNGERVKLVVRKATKFVEDNSPKRIARKFIELFTG